MTAEPPLPSRPSRSGEPYADMLHVRTAASRAFDRFRGQTISDRMLAASELLHEVARSGVAFDDPGLSYVEIQIDRATWEAIHAAD